MAADALNEVEHKGDLAYAREIVGKQAGLIGNVDTVSALLLGTKDVVKEQSDKFIAASSAGGG